MLYFAMYTVSLILKMTANILRNPAPDEPTVDVWIRHQTRVREAIAQAKSKNVAQGPGDSHDEWVGPWGREQTRFRQAIAQAKRENLGAKSCRVR